MIGRGSGGSPASSLSMGYGHIYWGRGLGGSPASSLSMGIYIGMALISKYGGNIWNILAILMFGAASHSNITQRVTHSVTQLALCYHCVMPPVL